MKRKFLTKKEYEPTALYQLGQLFHNISDGGSEANARLIAAAPELLEALKSVLDFGYLDNPFPAGQDYVSKKAIERVKLAIAKAEGK